MTTSRISPYTNPIDDSPAKWIKEWEKARENLNKDEPVETEQAVETEEEKESK